MHDLMNNNQLELTGKVISRPELCHEVYDEKFYSFNIEVPRLSGIPDCIPTLVSEKILDEVVVGTYVHITGQLRTYNKFVGEKRKLLIFAFARDIETITEEEALSVKAPNLLTLKGFVCKDPSYRCTPLGREITDLHLAVNRAYNKSDYVPVIAWGRNAKYCGKLEKGTEIEVEGRVQSRNYTKKTKDGEIMHTAIEVSLTKVVPVQKAAALQ